MKHKNFYTTYEAGHLLFVTHSTVIEWIKAGKIKAVKTLGGHRRIPKAELDTFIKKNQMRAARTTKKRILIVDDDKAIRLGLKELLENSGFEAHAACDGFEAGVLAIQHEPALIILDLKMQGIDGFSACKLIRSNPLLKKIKILVLTGYPSDENIERITKLGADQCLAKPVHNTELLKAISTLLQVQS